MTERFSLKDHLFNRVSVEYIADLLKSAQDGFGKEQFVSEVMEQLPYLELKERIRFIAAVLTRHLPEKYEDAIAVIVRSLPPPLDPTKTDDDFGEFIFAPFGEYVAVNGCTKERLAVSLETLRELTMRFSMEDAIRCYLRAFPKETLTVMKCWVRDDNYHVRRLVSEGTRPLLPWSGRVPLSSTDTLPLLTALHVDATRYVTRSVANHLNDIAKKEPAVVISILREWQQLDKQKQSELAWMTKHALRTLIKTGNQEAFSLLGYSAAQPNRVSFSVTPSQVTAGATIELVLTLESREPADFLIDYRIHFIKKNGTRVPKVFKWKVVRIKDKESSRLVKQHTLKADATTYTLYPGIHTIDVQINGSVIDSAEFTLLPQ